MSTINLVVSTKEQIKQKVAGELQSTANLLDNGSGFWSHEWEEDGSRKDEQDATGGGIVTITITFKG